MNSSHAEYSDPVIRNHTLNYVQSKADLIVELPEQPFIRDDLIEPIQNCLETLRREGIVETAGKREISTHQGAEYTVKEFVVRDAAREYAQQAVEKRDPICPCGHAGLENHGDHYECSAVICDAEHSRDDLEVGE